MAKKFFLLSLVWSMALLWGTLTLEAKPLSYSSLHEMPKSVEKDYYIWRFLSSTHTSKSDARRIIYDANHINSKLRKAYRKKTGSNPPARAKRIKTTPENIWRARSKANKSFKQGLALMRQKDPQQASRYFDMARQYYKKRYEKDKTLFWLYLSTKNKAYLQHLRASYHPNLYTLIAQDMDNGKYPGTVTERFSRSKLRGFDAQDPIAWAKIKARMNSLSNNGIEDLADDYTSQETIGIYTYLKAKASGHRKAYFPMPYRDMMKRMPPQRQALIYAIARQESRFVPASVSRSFALGMMQFMPFLIKHIAKQKGYHMDLDEMFNPRIAIEFADYHLNYLNRFLYHPLFVAYAYNAGIGFTKKHLRKSRNFRPGAYEPYMSMERMKNAEAREYGKKVLSNYVIYLNKLGVNTRITSLLNILTTPAKTDRFR